MRHVILTCKNHTNLRWTTKEIAVTDGKYNGMRSLFFVGEPTLDVNGNPQMHSDGSGLICNDTIPIRNESGSVVNYRVVPECKCKADCLMLAPEDSLVKR